MTEQEYLKSRVASQRTYFSQKASSNKTYYYFVSIAKLVISLVITVLSSAKGGASPMSILVSILSALIALTEGILLICKFNEKWITYRLTSENLKKEEFLFNTRSGEYYNIDDSQAYNSFVQNIEAIILSSNKQWEGIYKNKRGED